MRIAIAGAAGNIGRRTSEKVIQSGAETILLVRHPEKVSDLVSRGAIARSVSMDNATEIVKACRGVEALFWLIPPRLDAANVREWHVQTGQAGAAAAHRNRINRVVLISSVGAGSNPNLGTISYLGEVEGIFNEAAENVVALRAGFFMENYFAQAHRIRDDAAFFFPFPEEHDLPFVSTDDIGDVAANYLLDTRWAGRWTRNLMGPTNLTPNETASIISRVWDRSVAYVQVAVESVLKLLESMGATADVQAEFGNLFRAMSDPVGVYATARTPEAFTPTTFEQFARSKLLPHLTGESKAQTYSNS
ncbi:MAG TPA: NmrA family NAD(P)-binding protein [Bryobacteraceae bacterium]|jgi:uncharacterized protein YbjT (DUF2867 family)|nr:NmrA family NAD(P)-binding protein [Bryobacteraceae bacterium]